MRLWVQDTLGVCSNLPIGFFLAIRFTACALVLFHFSFNEILIYQKKNLPIGKKLRWDFFCALCGVYAENKTIPLSVVLTPFKFALVLVLKIDV